MAKYRVTITRTARRMATVEVEAADHVEAKQAAEHAVETGEANFGPEYDYETEFDPAFLKE